MAGSPTFTRAKHYTHFHTSHKNIYEGSETVHVKTDLTASVDGNYVIKADKISMENPVVFESTASLEGDVKIGGDLYVTGSMIVVATVLHQGDNTFGDEAGDNQKLVGTTTASGDLNVSVDAIVAGNASIEGTLGVAGNASLFGAISITSSLLLRSHLKYDQFVTASALATDPNIEGGTGLAIGGANDGWMRYWDITNATHIYSPYWNRG